jgi:hypothetical protein
MKLNFQYQSNVEKENRLQKDQKTNLSELKLTY